MNHADQPEFWWPSPSALDDLSVKETDSGFELEAPIETECGAWLSFFNETPERQEVFQKAFIEVLTQYCELIVNGQNQNQLNQQQNHPSETEKNESRPVA